MGQQRDGTQLSKWAKTGEREKLGTFEMNKNGKGEKIIEIADN